MSRKRKAPNRKIYPDPKYGSVVISKFINSIMYDGKRSTAERILYTALDKIKETKKEDPLKVFHFIVNILIFSSGPGHSSSSWYLKAWRFLLCASSVSLSVFNVSWMCY